MGKEVSYLESQETYDYFLDCKDTHKIWHIFEILLHGTIMDIMKMIKWYLGVVMCSHVPVIYCLRWQANASNINLKVLPCNWYTKNQR